MNFRIASQCLSIHCPQELRHCLNSLIPYETKENIDIKAVNIDILQFFFPDRLIPKHSNEYSGFLTHSSSDSNKLAFVFCFRKGSLLFGMQKEKNGVYNIYIHSHSSISVKTSIQYVLLLEGSKTNYLGMHAVTVECQNRGILFSAPSGTGKSTHTELWQKEFRSKILNGDFAMLRCENESITFDGTPFCGSSNYAERGKWPVTDIVFLKQAPHNNIRLMNQIEAIANTMENCFVPKWDLETAQLCLNLVNVLLKNVRTWLLECNMQPEAAHIAKNTILTYLDFN